MSAFVLLALAVVATVLLGLFVTVVVLMNREGPARVVADQAAGGAPAHAVASRLAQVESLRQRGLITADELGESRQRILGGL